MTTAQPQSDNTGDTKFGMELDAMLAEAGVGPSPATQPMPVNVDASVSPTPGTTEKATLEAHANQPLDDTGEAPSNPKEPPEPQSTEIASDDALTASIEAAFDDAENRLDDLAKTTNGDAISAESIAELDEHLADSTPEDIDLDSTEATDASTSEVAKASVSPIEASEPQQETETSPSNDTDACDVQNVPQASASVQTDPPTATDHSTQPSLQPDEAVPPTSGVGKQERTEILIGGETKKNRRQPLQVATAAARTAAVTLPRLVSAPLVVIPVGVRDMIGWLALVTAFNAACLWAYLVLVQ